jgi:hypothetical protein
MCRKVFLGQYKNLYRICEKLKNILIEEKKPEEDLLGAFV